VDERAPLEEPLVPQPASIGADTSAIMLASTAVDRLLPTPSRLCGAFGRAQPGEQPDREQQDQAHRADRPSHRVVRRKIL
jgi:hypothetical protein